MADVKSCFGSVSVEKEEKKMPFQRNRKRQQQDPSVCLAMPQDMDRSRFVAVVVYCCTEIFIGTDKWIGLRNENF